MIVKFFAHSKNAKGSIEYMLSDKDHKKNLRSVKPEIIQGDSDMTQEFINRAAEKFEHCYTSGVLTFEEQNIDPVEKLELINSFEKALFSGVEQEDYNIVWIEHRDKGRLELNFVVPKIHLSTDKSLNVYYHKIDQDRIDAWTDIKNIENGYSDPKAPKKRRVLDNGHSLPNEVKDLKIAVNDLVKTHEPQNRADVIEALNSIDSVTVSRETNKAISIMVEGRNKPIRLKGEYYDIGFRADKSTEQGIAEEQARFDASSRERLADAKRRYSERSEEASERNKIRYSRLDKAISNSSLDKHRNDNDISSGYNRVILDSLPSERRNDVAERESESDYRQSESDLQHHPEQSEQAKAQEKEEEEIEAKIEDIFTDERPTNIKSVSGMEGRESEIDRTLQVTERRIASFKENDTQHESWAAKFREQAGRYAERLSQTIGTTRENIEAAWKRLNNKLDKALEKKHETVEQDNSPQR